MEEADGGARGEGHPDTAASLHHVCHTHSLVLVRLEALLHTEGMGVSGQGCHPDQPPLSRVRGSHVLQERELKQGSVGMAVCNRAWKPSVLHN